MALFNTQPSRFGQATTNGVPTGDVDALFLKVFSGEIITTFEENNVMMPLHRVRTISSGKEAQFPITGVAEAKYHTPGESILSTPATTATVAGTGGTLVAPAQGSLSKYLSRIRHNEKIIRIDDVLTSSVFVADFDEMKNHYDVRSIYSTEIGRSLAYSADRALLRTAILGSRNGNDRFGGTDALLRGTSTPVGTDGDSLTNALFEVARKMDERNVPSSDRYCILAPAQYYLLVNGTSEAINRDFGNEGNGSMASGMIMSVAGIRIIKSNHLPTGDEITSPSTFFSGNQIKNDPGGGAGNGYSGANFSNNRGIVFHREGLATVKLMDLSVESEYIMERMGTLMLAKYAMGHGVLREECLHELVAGT